MTEETIDQLIEMLRQRHAMVHRNGWAVRRKDGANCTEAKGARR